MISPLQIFLVFLRLGLTSFGGPIAHLGYFRNEFVEKRKWIDEREYADLVALCQFLPGPASSQVGIAIGTIRGGYMGAIAAWLGFTLPSAILMILFAIGVSAQFLASGWIHGLKLAAVAIVAHALVTMAKSHCPNLFRAFLAFAAAATLLFFSSPFSQIAVILVSGILGALFIAPTKDVVITKTLPIERHLSYLFLILFGICFAPLAFGEQLNWTARLLEKLYVTGSLVFGGGHVVLPLLQSQVVDAGYLSQNLFLAGYGAAQALPGPLFTFAAFIGAASEKGISGWLGGLLATVAIFLPSFFLVFAGLPFWSEWRHHPRLKTTLLGINAGVVGILLAAFIFPLCSSTILRGEDLAIAAIGFVALYFMKRPAWMVVLFCAFAGQMAAYLA